MGRTNEQEANLSWDLYFNEGYFSKEQWLSHLCQINTVKSIQPESVLEIGCGNGIVTSMLKNHHNIETTTFDINANLKPDVLGSITELSRVLNNKTYELILCAEVLEHLPFELFDICLEEINKTSIKYVVLTLPIAGRYPIFMHGRIYRKSFNWRLRIPSSKIPDEHHWEINSSKNTNLKTIKEKINKYFDIKKSCYVDGHPRHYLFVLEKQML